MSKKLIIIGVVAGVIAVGSFVFAGYARKFCNPEKRAEFIIKKITKKLDLTNKQVETVNEIKKDLLEKRNDFRAVREEIHDDLMEQVKSDSFDKDEVKNILDRKKKKMLGMRNLIIDKAEQFHGILSSEQKEKLVDLIEKFKDKRHRMCGSK